MNNQLNKRFLKTKSPLSVSALLFGGLLCVFGSTANAALITVSDEHTTSITDWFDTLTVSQFDPTLGTLNSVKITFEADMMSDMTLDNDNATGTVAQGSVEVQTIGSFVGLGSLNVLLSDVTGFQNLSADDSGDTDIPGDSGPDEITVFGLAGDDMLMTTLTSIDADFASFIGVGDLSTAGLGTFGGFGVLGGGGNIDVNLNTTAGASLMVEYDFDQATTTVPEPTMLALLGLGLASFGFTRRRRSA